MQIFREMFNIREGSGYSLEFHVRRKMQKSKYYSRTLAFAWQKQFSIILSLLVTMTLKNFPVENRHNKLFVNAVGSITAQMYLSIIRCGAYETLILNFCFSIKSMTKTSYWIELNIEAGCLISSSFWLWWCNSLGCNELGFWLGDGTPFKGGGRLEGKRTHDAIDAWLIRYQYKT